jgi:hypothetical protein
MLLQPASYSDFLVLHSELGSSKTSIFYFDNGSTSFVIWAILPGKTIAIYSGNLVTQPGSFTTDFPQAIQVANQFGISV